MREIPEGSQLDTTEIQLTIDGEPDLTGVINQGVLLSDALVVSGSILDNTETGSVSASSKRIQNLGRFENYGAATFLSAQVQGYSDFEMWSGSMLLNGNKGILVNEGYFTQYGGEIQSMGDGVTIEIPRSTVPEIRMDEIIFEGGSFQAENHMIEVDLVGNPDEGFEIGSRLIQFTSLANITSKLGLNLPEKEVIPVSYDSTELDYAAAEYTELSTGYERLTGIALQTNTFETPTSGIVDTEQLLEELALYNVRIIGDVTLDPMGESYSTNHLIVEGDLHIVNTVPSSYSIFAFASSITADNIYINDGDGFGQIEIRIMSPEINVTSVILGNESQFYMGSGVNLLSSDTSFIIKGSSIVGIGGLVRSNGSVIERYEGNTDVVRLSISSIAAIGYKGDFVGNNQRADEIIYPFDYIYAYDNYINDITKFFSEEVLFNGSAWNKLIGLEGTKYSETKTAAFTGDPFKTDINKKRTSWNTKYQTEDIFLEENLINDIP